MREWIKLYTEIAHDRKMALLTDRQFRVCVNLFALAGLVDDGGIVPPIEDIAFQLRISENDLLADMHALADANIMQEYHGVWMVIHWIERQAKAPSDSREAILERVHKHRASKRNETVTPLQIVTNVTENVTTKKEREREKKEPSSETPKQPTEQQAMFGALETVCALDGKLMAPRIGKTAAKLTAAGYTVQQVFDFTSWWESDAWRAENTPTPTLAKVEELIKQSTDPLAKRNGHSSPDLIDNEDDYENDPQMAFKKAQRESKQ